MEINGVVVRFIYRAPHGAPNKHSGGGLWYWEADGARGGPFYSKWAAERDAREVLQ